MKDGDQEKHVAEDTPFPCDDDDKAMWYGWCSIKPKLLQCLHTIKFYVPMAVLLHLTFGFVSGWVGTGLQGIEKQFGLSSSVSATLSTASDLGNTCTVVFIGYIGTKVNKAKGLAIGLFLFGIGLILNSVPHYLIDPYQPPTFDENTTRGISPICPQNNSSESFGDANKGDNHMAYFSLLLVGQVISGLGATPVYTLGIAYLDDNAPVASAAILIGMVNAMSTVGASLSALAGGVMMEQIYVDFDRVDVSSLPFGPGDPQWLGAWWIGFIVCGLIFLIISVPISGFPNRMPGSPLKQKERKTDKEEDAVSLPRVLKNTVLDFFRAFFKLVLDAEYVFICISYSIEGVAVGGMSMFIFKFVNSEYDMDFGVAGYVIGTKAIVGSGGYILAGLVIKWLKLDLPGMQRMCTFFLMGSLILGLSLFLGCDNVDMPGLERPYPGDSSIEGLLSGCQGQCQCEGQSFNPVCAGDGLVYFSPCHAGCHDVILEQGVKRFTNCSCVALSNNVSMTDATASVLSGACDVACWQMYFVMSCLFIVYILIISCSTFSAFMVLRCVDQKLKPLALGIMMIFNRVIGTIPAPLVIGRIVDMACTVWSGPDNASGRYCQMYDKHLLTTGIAIMWLGAGLVSLTFMVLAMVANRLKRRHSNKSGEVEVNDGGDSVGSETQKVKA